MQIPIFTVDAFTSHSFSGNPAAVCLLENDLKEDLHQKIAIEMNLSETAFIRKLHSTDDFTKRDSDFKALGFYNDNNKTRLYEISSLCTFQSYLYGSCFGLRWFTPTSEVPLCGHATLAAAAVLFHIQKNPNSVLTFVTLSGDLKARQVEDRIVLDLPLYLAYPQVFQEVGELIKVAVGDMTVQDVRYSPDTKNLLVRLSDAYERSDLEELQVRAQNFLSAEKTGKVKGLIVTLKGDASGKPKGYDFYSRYFSPWYGVLEDPVTGSTHAVLGSYWSEQLGKKEMLEKLTQAAKDICAIINSPNVFKIPHLLGLPQTYTLCATFLQEGTFFHHSLDCPSCFLELKAFQCSRRGGELKISLRDDGRVDIAGQYAIVIKGNLTF